MKIQPNVELDAQMLAAHKRGRLLGWRLLNNVTRLEVIQRARWLPRQPDEYRRRVRERLVQLLRLS